MFVTRQDSRRSNQWISCTRGGINIVFLFFSFLSSLFFFFFLPSIHHDALLRATIERTTIDVEILKLKSKESTELSVPERLRELRMMYA